MIGWFDKRCTITQNRTAVVDGETGERWTYKELQQRVHTLAAQLAKLGIERGDRVALLAPNHISYLDLLFACGKLGAIFVPLNWRLAWSELAAILQDCTPKIVFVHRELQTLSAQIGATGDCLLLEAGGDAYNSMLLQNADTIPPLDRNLQQPSDPLAIIYTGGTTGRPKGVILSHSSIYNNAINTALTWSLTMHDVTPTYLPMFHTGGLNALSVPVLLVGGTVIIARQFDAKNVIALLNRENCTIALMVPTMYHMLIESPDFAQTDFPTMHTFLSGGAPCPKSVYKAFANKGLAFKEGYGATETGPNNFYIDPRESVLKPGSVGKPMLLNEVRIVGDEGRDCGDGEVGELLLAGSHLFKGYWNQPETTEQAMKGGWFHTGDLAKRDADGYYYIVGRKKDMIITGGENVYPLEVEQLIASHTAVRDVAVVGLPDDKWGEIVAALVVLHDDAALSAADIQRYCADRIGKYKIPKKVLFATELPVTSVGKLDKKAMVEACRSGHIV